MLKITFLLWFLFTISTYSETYRLVRFYPTTESEIKQIESIMRDYSGFKSTSVSYDLIVNENDYLQFENLKIKYETIVPNLESHYALQLSKTIIPDEFQSDEYFRTGSIGGYFTHDEIYAEFDRMMERYPDLISKNLEGNSIENRPIYSYCIGNRACFSDNNFPQVLITALHHAREPGSIFTVLYYFWDLLKRADSGDELALYMLRNRHIFIIPVLNPDGVIYNETNSPDGGGLWRKNRRINSDSTYGVDLNRNYGPEFAWNSPNEGSSLEGKNDTYRGTAPFSEPETQCIRNFLNGKLIKTGVNYHTFANAVFYPYSYLTSESPDSLWFRNFLSENYRNNRYLFGIDADVINYPTRGSADDYMYMGDSGFSGFLSMTCEVGNSVHGFWAPLPVILEYAEQNIKFIDNLILSASRNIAIADKDAVVINGKYYLKLNIANIGYDDLEAFDIQITSRDGKTSIPEELINVAPLKRGDTSTVYVEYFPTDTENGDLAEFELNAYLDYTKKIDFRVQIFDYQEIDMFDYRNEVLLDGDWYFAIDEAGGLILSSNIEELYKPDMSSYAIFTIPPHGDSVLRYSLHFEHTFNIESNYDFGIIITKSQNDDVNNPNFGEYLVNGISRPGSSQNDLLWGFQGYFKYWMPQTVFLTNKTEQLKEFAFNLRTDKGSNRSGWKIRDLKLRIFTKKSTSVNEVVQTSPIRLAPNPTNNSFINILSDNDFDNAGISIVDVYGRVCFSNNLNIFKGINIINTNFLTSGRYILTLQTKNGVHYLPLVVTK